MEAIKALCQALKQDKITLTLKCFACKKELAVSLCCNHGFNITGGCLEYFEDNEVRVFHKECW